MATFSRVCFTRLPGSLGCEAIRKFKRNCTSGKGGMDLGESVSTNYTLGIMLLVYSLLWGHSLHYSTSACICIYQIDSLSRLPAAVSNTHSPGHCELLWRVWEKLSGVRSELSPLIDQTHTLRYWRYILAIRQAGFLVDLMQKIYLEMKNGRMRSVVGELDKSRTISIVYLKWKIFTSCIWSWEMCALRKMCCSILRFWGY